jgi:NAD(P)-dependent dehydrogenase (short-subunit alcohol dehydrogenase family)
MERLLPGIEIRLDGKVALVTGGTRGIGRAIATRLIEAGATVIVCGRGAPEAFGAEFIACDIRDPEAATAMIDAIGTRHGGLDILVNNAGGSPAADAATASPRFSERVIALNLLAPLNLSQAAHKWMSKRGGGAIVNIASVSATRPSPGTAAYSAAKGGLLALGRSLAHEWGPAIRVNAIVVGYVETEATEATYGDAATQAAIAGNIAAGRLARAGEIADAVLYLASPLASYVTGAALHVDGGGERPPFLDIVKEHHDGR